MPPAKVPESTPAAPRLVERHRGLMGRAVLVSGLTLLSRLLGFLREALMAAVFGETSAISDAFVTAWRIPNLFRRLLGEGALSTSLQAAMTRADGERGDSAGRALFHATVRITSTILVVTTLAGMALAFWMPDRMPGTGWAWLGEDPQPVRDLTLRVMPYVLLVCLAALCAGALAVRGHFALPSLAPTVMNLVWIGALVCIGVATGWGHLGADDPAERLQVQWRMGRWLAWGLLLGGTLQLGLHLVPLRRFGLLGPGVGADRTDAWRVLRQTAPLVVGAAIYQINVMIDGLMAESLLRNGGPSALYYANRIQQFPLALISTAAISAVFPALNAYGHLGERGKLRALHDRTQLGILFLALPSAAGLFALATPIASVCLEHGNFGLDGTLRVAAGLRALSLALIPAGAATLASRVYVSLGDLKTPVRIAAWMLLINVCGNLVCVLGLGMDVAGLALPTAIGSGVNLAWLVLGLRRVLGLPAADPSLPGRIARMVLAALLCAGAAWAAHAGTALLLGAVEPRRSFAALGVGTLAGALAFALAARLLGLPEWRELMQRLGRGAGPRGPGTRG